MRIPLLVFTLLLAVTNLMAQSGDQSTSDAQSWKRYTAEERDFSVMMPKVPVLTLSKNSVTREHRHQGSLKTSVDNVSYSVLSSENRKPLLGLEEFIKEQLIRGWDLNSERRVTVNGISGKEYLSKDRNIVAQFFVTEKSLYRFLTKGAPADDPRVKQFFSSIELGEKVTGTRVQPEDGVVYYFQDEPDVFKGTDVDRRVQVLAKPEPVAVAGPPEASGSKFSVILRAVFSYDGNVTNITVIKGAPGEYTQSAIEAARKIKFVPATKDGVPVSMWMQLEYRFPF